MKKLKKVQVWVVYKKEVLMLRVIGDRGGGWHPITANLEPRETFLKAAQRETREETSIHAKDGKWIELDYAFEYEGRWGPAEEHVFAMILSHKPKKIVIDPSEHTEWKWMMFGKAKQALHFAPQREALELLKEKLKCLPSQI